MSGVSRRHVLQFGASALAAIGLSQLDFLNQARQFDRALAQSTNAPTPPRKYALLVGINDYPAKDQLRGCLNDVEAMRILLEHRYGFDSDNIEQLTNAQATRQGILSAFEQMIAKVQPGDVFVFHFSGHGSMVLDPDPNPGFVYNNQGVNGTLVPYDSGQGEAGRDRVIMGHTLFLLMSALRTENVTVVLDCCYSAGGLRGNTRVRSLTRADGQISAAPDEELKYQKDWLNRLKLSESEFVQARKRGIAKGIGIGAATLEQEALDKQFEDFHCGAFTYLLTRYLWQLPTSQSLGDMFTSLKLSTQMSAAEDGYAQVPNYEAKPASTHPQQPIFFSTASRPAAEAVIHKPIRPGQPIEFWLSGVSPSALKSYGTGTVFMVVDAEGREVGELVQTDRRKGLEASGKLQSGQIQPVQGMLLREQIRNLPPNFKLKVGLDESLGAALPTVQQALTQLNWLEVAAIAPTQNLHYIIGRMAASNAKRLQTSRQGLPPTNAISLFTADLTPIPDAFAPPDAAISKVLDRLRPRLKSLFVGEILRAIVGNTSPLKVSADVLPVDGNNTPIGKGRTLTTRGLQSTSFNAQTIKQQPIKIGTNLGVRVKNSEAVNLYVAVLVISDSEEMGVLFPFGFQAPESASLVAANTEFPIPVPFEVYGTPGFMELLILVSKEPLRQALLALRAISAKEPDGTNRGRSAGLTADDADQVVSSLLGDVDRISTRSPMMKPKTLAIDSGKLAALSVVLEVVK